MIEENIYDGQNGTIPRVQKAQMDDKWESWTLFMTQKEQTTLHPTRRRKGCGSVSIYLVAQDGYLDCNNPVSLIYLMGRKGNWG